MPCKYGMLTSPTMLIFDLSSEHGALSPPVWQYASNTSVLWLLLQNKNRMDICFSKFSCDALYWWVDVVCWCSYFLSFFPIIRDVTSTCFHVSSFHLQPLRARNSSDCFINTTRHRFSSYFLRSDFQNATGLEVQVARKWRPIWKAPAPLDGGGWWFPPEIQHRYPK